MYKKCFPFFKRGVLVTYHKISNENALDITMERGKLIFSSWCMRLLVYFGKKMLKTEGG